MRFVCTFHSRSLSPPSQVLNELNAVLVGGVRTKVVSVALILMAPMPAHHLYLGLGHKIPHFTHDTDDALPSRGTQ